VDMTGRRLARRDALARAGSMMPGVDVGC